MVFSRRNARPPRLAHHSVTVRSESCLSSLKGHNAGNHCPSPPESEGRASSTHKAEIHEIHESASQFDDLQSLRHLGVFADLPRLHHTPCSCPVLSRGKLNAGRSPSNPFRGGRAGNKLLGIANPGFEQSGGWTGLTRSSSRSLKPYDAELYAPPEGNAFAVLREGARPTTQTLPHRIEAGKTYTLKVWARSVNPQCTEPDCAVPETLASLALTADGDPLSKGRLQVALNPPLKLEGAAGEYTNDDGANVWFDGKYRMQAGEFIFYQERHLDPIEDPWSAGQELPSPANYAPGQITTPEGLRALYTTTGPVDDEKNPKNSCLLYCDCCKPTRSFGEPCEMEADEDPEDPDAQTVFFSAPPRGANAWITLHQFS